MTRTRTRVAALAAGLSACWFFTMPGCVAPEGAAAPAPEAQSPPAVGSVAEAAPPPPPATGPFDPAVAARLAECRRRLDEFLPDADLGASLYLGWMLEPYERATLAVAVKTVAVLEREQHLRLQRNGALSAERIAAMLAWVERALDRQHESVPLDFQPNRIHPELNLADVGNTSPAYFTFADRASVTANDRTLGDLDLLASAGFRWYAWDAAAALTSAGAARRARAQSMGCALLEAPARFVGERRAPAGSPDLSLQPVTLAQLFAGEVSADGMPAVIDLPGGESLIGMLARRQLLRGVTGQPGVAAIGIDAGGEDVLAAPQRVRAAMWLQALAGQQLGVFEGWRDARDGTLTPYPSRLGDPEYLEAVAHTALDLLRFADVVTAARMDASVGIVLPADFALTSDGNTWAPACLALLGELDATGQPFCILPATATPAVGTPAVRVVVEPTDAPSSDLQAAREGDTWHVRVPREPAGAHRAGATMAALLESGGAPATSTDIRSAGDQPVIQRMSPDGRTCVAVNCAGANVAFLVRSNQPDDQNGAWTDRLTGVRLDPGPVAMGPWQVRVLQR